MTGSNTSIRTKTRHPADFFIYVAIYVCAILSEAMKKISKNYFKNRENM